MINLSAVEQISLATRAALDMAEDAEAMRHIGDVAADVVNIADLQSMALRQAENEVRMATRYLKFRQKQLAQYRLAIWGLKSGLARSFNRPFDIAHKTDFMRGFFYCIVKPARRELTAAKAVHAKLLAMVGN